MTDLIQFLAANPILIIVIGGIVLQALGKLGANAARKVVEQQEKQAAGSSAEPQPRPARARPAPEDIAREIRRAMGIEEEAAVEVRRPPVVVRRQEPPLPQQVTPPAAIIKPSLGSSISVDVGSTSDALVQPLNLRSAGFVTSPVAPRPPTPRRPKRGLGKRQRRLDLNDPAAVIIAAEVLGPPRAMRGWEV